MQIAKNTVVSMHYKVATAEGEHIDASTPEQPLVFIAGAGNIIPGLDKAIAGKQAGDKVEAVIPPAEAYGEHDSELDLVVAKGAFPKDAHKHLAPGFRFRADHPKQEGAVTMFTVHKIEGEEVFVSGNHELAGKTLNFQVEIVSVRAASAEELAHGHVHGEGGHHH
jgi:FKBP-type peptidyl-prolyl cis-trans isomerase SlyD